MGNSRLAAVDGLRGIAIFMVIYQHVYAGPVRQNFRDMTGGFAYIIGNAWMGVGLFFILSGFVLALPFAEGKRSLHDRADFNEFYKRRFARIGPLFIFMAFVGYAFTVKYGNPATGSLLLTLSTLSMFTKSQFFPTINGPFWSLAVEIWFSILCPFILFRMMKNGPMKTAAVIAVAALSIRLVGTQLTFSNSQVNPVKDFLIARMDDFALGMVIAISYARGILPKLRDAHSLAGIAAILIAAILWDFQESFPSWAAAFFNLPLQIGVALLLIAALSGATLTTSFLTKWPLRLAGAMCFSLYCWHYMLIGPTISDHPFGFKSNLIFWTSLAVLASFTYRFIEFPKVPVRALLLIPTRGVARPRLEADAVRRTNAVSK